MLAYELLKSCNGNYYKMTIDQMRSLLGDEEYELYGYGVYWDTLLARLELKYADNS